MTASLTTFVGAPKARSKSNPTQPLPRLTGSAIARPPRTGVGIPRLTAFHVQSSVMRRTPSTISCGRSAGPESKRRGSSTPGTIALTCDPPTSTARTTRSSGGEVIAAYPTRSTGRADDPDRPPPSVPGRPAANLRGPHGSRGYGTATVRQRAGRTPFRSPADHSNIPANEHLRRHRPSRHAHEHEARPGDHAGPGRLPPEARRHG